MKINDNSITSLKNNITNGIIAGVRLPDFNGRYAFNKKKTKTTDKEYAELIKEQAAKDYADGKFQNGSQGFNQLMKAYVSEVSPDRQRLITEGLQKIESGKKKVMEPVDLVTLLFKGELKYKYVSEVEYAEFYDENGEQVARYSNGRWILLNTKKETARQIAMCNIYNREYGRLKREDAALVEAEMNDDYAEPQEGGFNAFA